MHRENLTHHIERLAGQLQGELRSDRVARTVYSTDASVYQETPLAVATPRTEADVQRLIMFAREHGVGLIPRTAGTSLSGQVVGSGIVVDVSRHFTEILEINPQERWVRVQPGVIRNELNMALRSHGLLFGPETSTQNRAMIGGMVGNNSCGSNSIVYGSTRDHLLEVRGFLSDGTLTTIRDLDDQRFAEKCDGPEDSLEAQIYRGTRELLSDVAVRDEITREFPKPEIPRRNTGYAIDLLMDASPLAPPNTPSDRPFNFCNLIAGSEGTLFFATEIKLACDPLPPAESALLCAHFPSVDEALRATVLAVKHDIYACELIDHFVLEGAARNIAQRDNMSFVDGEPGAILVTEFRGDNDQQVRKAAAALQRELSGQNLGYHYPLLLGQDTNKVWDLRKAGLGIVSNVPGDTKPYAVIEDTAVTVNDLPEYIGRFNEHLKSKYGLQCVHYAHAGTGEIHLRPILNLKTAEGNARFRGVAVDIANLVKEFGGSLSGEHGDGRLRGEFLSTMVGEKNYEVMRQIKQLWDPQNIMNPHKIIGAPPMNEQLRYMPGHPTPQYPTVLDFSESQGVLRAAEMCNGSGDCRKTELTGGTMCPSYMATRAEQETTRGRANVLRAALTQPVDPDKPFDNPDALEVLDLCLSCKGCRRECPSNVDMAKLKAEFMQGYYDTHGVPRRSRIIADYARSSALASRAAGLVNLATSNDLIASWIKAFIGFAPQRSIPPIARPTLRRWFDTHSPHANAGSSGSVLLFCDEFTNFGDASVGIATIELLERLGYRVEIPSHVESGRAAISKGLLRKAKRFANKNVRQLAPIATTEKPLLGIEPSAILTFRDEYTCLVDEDLRASARQLSENCLMIDEFIAREMDAGKIKSDRFTEQEKTVRLHGHCHQKALASLAPTVRMLGLPKNYTVRLIPSGCCGMAGSFGYEKEHYEISMQIGELVLFPTVRSEPAETIIAAPGTSCRHQIFDGTRRRARHPSEILLDALVE